MCLHFHPAEQFFIANIEPDPRTCMCKSMAWKSFIDFKLPLCCSLLNLYCYWLKRFVTWEPFVSKWESSLECAIVLVCLDWTNILCRLYNKSIFDFIFCCHWWLILFGSFNCLRRVVSGISNTGILYINVQKLLSVWNVTGDKPIAALLLEQQYFFKVSSIS